MKNKKLIMGLAIALIAIIAVVSVILIVTKPETQDGSKQIEVTVVYKDKTEKLYEIDTDAEYLADALLEEELITKTEYEAGYYTVIDGVTADYNVDSAWWCVTKGGEMTSVGMNQQPIADGDEFEITYTIN